MIIDFHTHIFPDAIAGKSIAALSKVSNIPAATDGTVNGLLKSMDAADVDMSVIMPVVTKPSQFHSVNLFAKQVNETYNGRLLSFGGIHPASEDYKAELDQIKELGLPGIKLHPDYQRLMIDDVRYMNIIEYANELDLIILTHAGIDIGLPEPVHCTPKKLRYVIDTIKPKKFVAAHMGGWKLWEEVCEYLVGENIYFDTAFSLAYMEPEMFLKIWKMHDKNKILFATDSPWSGAREEVRRVSALPLNEEQKADLFANNAKTLLGLNAE